MTPVSASGIYERVMENLGDTTPYKLSRATDKPRAVDTLIYHNKDKALRDYKTIAQMAATLRVSLDYLCFGDDNIGAAEWFLREITYVGEDLRLIVGLNFIFHHVPLYLCRPILFIPSLPPATVKEILNFMGSPKIGQKPRMSSCPIYRSTIPKRRKVDNVVSDVFWERLYITVTRLKLFPKQGFLSTAFGIKNIISVPRKGKALLVPSTLARWVLCTGKGTSWWVYGEKDDPDAEKITAIRVVYILLSLKLITPNMANLMIFLIRDTDTFLKKKQAAILGMAEDVDIGEISKDILLNKLGLNAPMFLEGIGSGAASRSQLFYWEKKAIEAVVEYQNKNPLWKGTIPFWFAFLTNNQVKAINKKTAI